LTCDFEIETSSVNEEHNHSTTPTSRNYSYVMETNNYTQ